MKKILVLILSLYVAVPTFAENVESKQNTAVVTLGIDEQNVQYLKASCGYMHYAKEEKAYYLYSTKTRFEFCKDDKIKEAELGEKAVFVTTPQKPDVCFFRNSDGRARNDLEHCWRDVKVSYLQIKENTKVECKVGVEGKHKLYLMPVPQAIDSICVESVVGCTLSNDSINCTSDTCIIKLKRHTGTRFKKAFFNEVELPDSIVKLFQSRNGKYGGQSYDEFTADNAIIEINLSNLERKEENKLRVVYDGFVEETLKEQTTSFILVSSTNNKLVSWLKEHKVVGYICIGILVLVLLIVLVWCVFKFCKRKNGDTSALTKQGNEQADSTSKSTDSTEITDPKLCVPTPQAQPETCEEWLQKAIDTIESSKGQLIPQLPQFNWLQTKFLSDQIVELSENQKLSQTTIDKLIQEMSEIKFAISKVCQNDKESYTQLESERNELQKELNEKKGTIDRLQPVVDEYEYLKRQVSKLQALKDADKELSDIGKLTEKITTLETKIKLKEGEIISLTAQKNAAESSLENEKRVHNDAITLLKNKHKSELEQKDKSHNEATSKLIDTHAKALESEVEAHKEATSKLKEAHSKELAAAEQKRKDDIAAEQEKSREKIGEWYKDKKFYDENLDSHLQGIKQAVDTLYTCVANDQMAEVYYQTIERSVTTLNMLLDYVSLNSEDWETKGCSHIYKSMQSKLREQLSDKVSWINSILRLFCFSDIPSLNDRMQKCGIAFNVLDQAYRHTVVLLSNYGIQVEVAKPFIDDYENNAINSYFEYNNMDSMIESYTGLSFLREQYAKADGKKIITDMCRVAYFYQTDNSIELVKGEVTFFS